MKKAAIILSLLFLFPCFSLPAAEIEPKGTMLRKLQRGAVNVLLSPIEIAVELAKVKNCDTFPPSWALGASRGSFYMIGRIVTGAYEIVTFPFPLPAGYAPILEPEFPWELEGLRIGA